MTNNINEKVIKVAFRKAKLVDFSTTPIASALTEQIDEQGYQFRTDIKYDIIVANKLINSTVNIKVSRLDNQDELANMESFFSFYIENLEELLHNDKGNTNTSIDPVVLLLVAQASVSTSRGMFVVASQNTILNNAVMPIMDSTNLLPKRPL